MPHIGVKNGATNRPPAPFVKTHSPPGTLLHFMLFCPKRYEVWQQLLTRYTKNARWTEEGLQTILSLDTKSLAQKLHSASLITAHQLAASGLAGIWRAHISRYLEDTALPATAIFNTMNSNARKYHALNKA